MLENNSKIKKRFKEYEMVTVVERLHAFSTANHSFDYGTGEKYHSGEVHMLSYIADNPGITPSEIASNWNQTRGATSQMLRKLTDRGLIKTEQHADDRRVSCLYVTDKGIELDQKHKKFDEDNIKKFLNELRKEYTEDEIQLAYNVLDSWVELFFKLDNF